MRGNWLGVSVALLIGCGGRIDTGDDGGPPPVPGVSSDDADAAGRSVSNTTPSQGNSGFDICPPDPPEVGTACSVSYACAYSVPASPSTCQRFTCDPAGHWQGTAGSC
jgi:hypothetical protein